MKLGMYIRVSTTRQAEEGVSLDNQEATIKRHIKDRYGCKAVDNCKVYREEGASARTGSVLTRPQFKRMLIDAKNEIINCVVVYRIDRFARSTMDFWNTYHKLESMGIAFISINNDFDTTSPEGKLQITFQASMTQYESDINSHRTKSAISFLAQNGKSHGSPVVGYKRNSDGVLEIIEEQAQLIQMVFKKMTELGSAGAVLKFLNTSGYRMPERITKKGKVIGGGAFNKNTLINWLTNPKYIGKMPLNGEIHEGAHKPIIDTGLFNQVGKILELNREVKRIDRENDRIYLLKSLLSCGCCGKKMTPKPSGGRGKSYPYYVCTQQNHQKTTCLAKAVPADAVEDLVVSFVKNIEGDKDLIRQITQEANSQAKELADELQGEYGTVKMRLAKLIGELDNLIGAMARFGDETPDSILEKVKSLEKEKKKLKDQESKVHLELSKAKRRLLDNEVMMRSLHHFRQVVEVADRKSLAKIMPLFIKEIEWSQDEKDPTTGHIRVSVYEDFSPDETDTFVWSKPDGACVKSGPKRCEVKLPSSESFTKSLHSG
ncbi:MAG: recombinase family protein [Planctomycetes bacterium]|nr:recombinase family protein [Planctomycetota bacterium]